MNGSVVVGGALGYDAYGNSLPDGSAEITGDGNPENLVLKGAKINPLAGLSSTWLVGGNYLTSYNQVGDLTGTVRVYGDYAVAAQRSRSTTPASSIARRTPPPCSCAAWNRRSMNTLRRQRGQPADHGDL